MHYKKDCYHKLTPPASQAPIQKKWDYIADTKLHFDQLQSKFNKTLQE